MGGACRSARGLRATIDKRGCQGRGGGATMRPDRNKGEVLMPATRRKDSTIKTRNSLTPQQQKFVDAFFEYGGNIHAAGQAVTGKARSTYGYLAMEMDNVRRVIQNESRRRIEERLLPLTHWALERILSDPKTPGAAIVAASKLVWEAAGTMAPSAGGGGTGGGGKELHEMTVDEMEGELRRLRDLADRRIALTTSVDLQAEDVEPPDSGPVEPPDPFA